MARAPIPACFGKYILSGHRDACTTLTIYGGLHMTSTKSSNGDRNSVDHLPKTHTIWALTEKLGQLLLRSMTEQPEKNYW